MSNQPHIMSGTYCYSCRQQHLPQQAVVGQMRLANFTPRTVSRLTSPPTTPQVALFAVSNIGRIVPGSGGKIVEYFSDSKPRSDSKRRAVAGIKYSGTETSFGRGWVPAPGWRMPSKLHILVGGAPAPQFGVELRPSVEKPFIIPAGASFRLYAFFDSPISPDLSGGYNDLEIALVGWSF